MQVALTATKAGLLEALGTYLPEWEGCMGAQARAAAALEDLYRLVEVRQNLTVMPAANCHACSKLSCLQQTKKWTSTLLMMLLYTFGPVLSIPSMLRH